MAAMRNAVDFVVDLVEELSAEDKALVPQFDLTAESDEDVSSPHPVNASVHSSSPEANAEDEEVRFWPVCPGRLLPTVEPRVGSACVGGSSSTLSQWDSAEYVEEVIRAPTRWGRCDGCQRALRPGVTSTGSPVLLCSKFKPLEGHTYRMFSLKEAEGMDFPRLMVRRLRMLW